MALDAVNLMPAEAIPYIKEIAAQISGYAKQFIYISKGYAIQDPWFSSESSQASGADDKGLRPKPHEEESLDYRHGITYYATRTKIG